MKKYLMTGIAAVAMCAAFTSCSKDTTFEQVNQNEIAKAQYEAAFVQRFGEINKNHTWGFSTNTTSRAMTRAWNDGQPYASSEGKFWARTDDAYKAQYNYKVPAVLTAAQKDKVRRYFQQNQDPGGKECENMTEYFVQHVYTGTTNLEGSLTTEKYYDGNLTLQPCRQHMDQFSAGTVNLHVEGFNATTASYREVWDGFTYEAGYPKANESYVENWNHAYKHQDQIMLMGNVDTQSFGYHNSMASNWDTENYRLVSGDVIQAWDNSTVDANGENADVSGMMFLGFDYEGKLDNDEISIQTDGAGNRYFDGNLNKYGFRLATADDPADKKAYMKGHVGGNNPMYVQGCADGYFSDWIVRIIKAEKNKEIVEEGRIICEDLGTSDDFDFNDIVFDATIYTDGTCDITILAAGGTLDVTVAGQDIHSHTGQMTLKCNYSFTVSGYNRLIDIPIVVSTTNSAGEITSYALHCEKGAAPQKICVGKDYKWCTERTHIDDAYLGFKTWVKEDNGMEWTKNPVAGLVVE